MSTGKKGRSRKKTPSIRTRSTILMAVFLLVGFGASILRIAYLQFGIGEELKSRAVSQQFSNITLSAKRGAIYDRNGKVLAQSASVWKIACDPSEFETEEEIEYTAQGLSQILSKDKEKIAEKLRSEHSQYEILAEQVESDVKDKVVDFVTNAKEETTDENGKEVTVRLMPENGINIYDDYKRYYPYGSLASAVIGFTGSDDQGLIGLEYEYDDVLKGTPGKLVAAQNANGGTLPFEYKQNIEAQEGKSIVLTIDENIQSVCEKYLLEAIEEFEVYNRACCIVMNPKNGEILANATIGGFDLNDPFTLDPASQKKYDETPEDKKEEEYIKLVNEMWRNKTVTDTYYPGSVFKMITGCMALQENLITDNSRFYCNGVMSVYDYNIHCHDWSGHGTQTFEEAIYNSCNPALIQIGQLVGAERFWKYYQAFGFDKRTGVDLPSEFEDNFFSEDGTMGPVDLAVASFGQNFSITPMQMITAASAVANGGYIVQPHIVKQIIDSDGNVTETINTQVKRQVISEEVSARMCKILEDNVISGGGTNAYVPGYRIAGKTGTSEKKEDSNGDGVDDYIGSFCGFAPADDAQVIMLVFCDTPTGVLYHGSKVAAPVFAKVMEEILPYMQIEPQYTEAELDVIDAKAGSYVGLDIEQAKQNVEADGFLYNVKGDGSTVISQSPEAGAGIPKGGTIVLHTDEESRDNKVIVPNFLGSSLSEANSLAAEYGVNISVTGGYSAEGSRVKSQSVEYGTMVPNGSVIELSFANYDFND